MFVIKAVTYLLSVFVYDLVVLSVSTIYLIAFYLYLQNYSNKAQHIWLRILNQFGTFFWP